MNRLLITHPSKIVTGAVELPASKSISNRYLIIYALAQQSFNGISNLSDADDTKLMYHYLNQPTTSPVINVENAGTCMRFLTAYFAIQPGADIILHGNTRMNKRPVKELVDALKKLGADIDYIAEDGFLPIRIKGKKLAGGKITIDGSKSSQMISAMLLIAPYLQGGLEIQFDSIVSKSYVDLTLQCMHEMGAAFQQEDNAIKVLPIPYTIKPITIESDWSAAAFFYAQASLAKESAITLLNLNKNSLQPDAFVANFMDRFQVFTEIEENNIKLVKSPYLFQSTIFDLVNCPDIVQPISVAIGLQNVHCELTGIAHLRYKETDRLDALYHELNKLGVHAEVVDEQLILGGCTINPDEIHEIETYGDHRMAMAFAAAALVFNKIIILHPEVVSKSFPKFWQQLKQLGYQIQELQ
jgi:3-phosphoshikimate 1-carboxyvinyltransferase